MKTLGWAALTLWVIFLNFAPAVAQPDSVQVYLHSGLDEMGGGGSFSGYRNWGAYWLRTGGQGSSLYRQPQSTQGNIRSNMDFSLQVGRMLRPYLDLEGVFEGDFYQFQQYSGPSTLRPVPSNPAGNWMSVNQLPAPNTPPQRISSPLLGVGAIYHPTFPMKVTATVGQRWDQREGYDDHGYSSSIAGALDGWTLGTYRNSLNIYGLQEELGERRNHELRLQYDLSTDFTSSSSDKLNVNYRRKRHDYHVWGTNLIGTRLDTDYQLSNQLRYRAGEGYKFLLDTQIGGSRHEDQSAGAAILRQEVTTATGLTLQTDFAPVSNSTSLKLDWGAQEDATGLKRERGISLEGDLTWLAAQRDVLSIAAAVRKRQYDTSDTANYDDRDRLRYEFQIDHTHYFNASFYMVNRAQVILEHLVYIYGQKSDQNNWNRIFKVSPEVFFSPAKGWGNLARFEIAAIYSDYDFELDPANIKSTVYRRYTAADSLGWTWRRGWDLILDYSVDLEDGGRLLWSDWIEQISEQYRSQKATIRVNRETASGIQFQTGFTVYQRKGWQYELGESGQTEKSPFLLIDRWGPMIRLLYPSRSGLQVDIAGDFSRVHQWLTEDYSIINLDVRITYR